MRAAQDCTSPGRPKAHFSFSRGTSAAAIPAAPAGWNLVFERFCPKPLHRAAPGFGGPLDAAAEHIAAGVGAMEKGAPRDFPLANSAMARRSAVVRPCVIDTMDPNSSASRMRWAVMPRSTSRRGRPIRGRVVAAGAVLLVERGSILRVGRNGEKSEETDAEEIRLAGRSSMAS